MHDEFLVWLVCANAGMLHSGNVFCLDDAIHHLPNEAPIIETGSFCGLSTNALASVKRRNGVANRLIPRDR